MTKVVKKRLRLKKRNFIVFLIIIITFFVGTHSVIKQVKTHLKNKAEIEKKEQTPPKKEKKEEKKEGQEDLPDYYNKQFEQRYKDYEQKHPELSKEQVITQVNIGLDYDYYENTKKTKFLNKSYILVNKYNYLPDDYVPNKLESINTNYALSNMKLVSYAKDAYEKMAKDAKKEKLNIIAMSTYRSYKYQVNLYNKYKDKDGLDEADSYSARPGYSEHQTGLAVDVYNGTVDYTSFEKTKEFTWMQENAYKYGFILRFPKNKTKETGYKYESWHYRYVGVEIASYIHEHDICFEEYYVTKIETY